MRIPSHATRIARWLAVALAVAAICGPFLSPNSPEAQNLPAFFSPPTRIHFVDASGRFHWRAFVYRSELKDPLEGSYAERTETRYPLSFFGRGWNYEFLGMMPSSRHLVLVDSGAQLFLFGADDLGRDVLARVLAGARTSLVIVLLGILAYGLLGFIIGAAAATSGGWSDALLMRFSEFVLALPALYLILALRALLPQKLHYWQTVFLTVGTIAAVSWPPMARGIRGMILQLKGAGYVEAARSMGSTPVGIFVRHILPAITPLALTQTAVAAPLFILGEVVLSYLGVGFHDADDSWGAMLQLAKDPRVLTDFQWNLAPLGFVFVTLLCLNLLSGEPNERSLRRTTL